MTDWAKYLEGAYRRTLDKERDLLLFIDEIAKAVDLRGDNVTFEQVLTNVKGLRSAYANQCDRLRQACERHKLGLGGEHVDALVIEALDSMNKPTGQVAPSTNNCAWCHQPLPPEGMAGHGYDRTTDRVLCVKPPSVSDAPADAKLHEYCARLGVSADLVEAAIAARRNGQDTLCQACKAGHADDRCPNCGSENFVAAIESIASGTDALREQGRHARADGLACVVLGLWDERNRLKDQIEGSTKSAGLVAPSKIEVLEALGVMYQRRWTLKPDGNGSFVVEDFEGTTLGFAVTPLTALQEALAASRAPEPATP